VWEIEETSPTFTRESDVEIVSPTTPKASDVNAVDVAAAALRRLAPPPRRLTTPQLFRLLEAGTPGRPIVRRLALSAAALVLAMVVILPDWVYSWHPTYELAAIGAEPRETPVDAVTDVVPGWPRTFIATYRVPSGEVQEGPVSRAEYDAIQAGSTSLMVHMTGGRMARARPASGLFGVGRLAVTGLLALVSLAVGFGSLRRIAARWWTIRVARRGLETVGRITEMHADRLVRRDRPVGWIYTLYYVFGAANTTTVEGMIREYHVDRHLPFDKDRPLRLLYLDTPPYRSIPADLLPLSPSKR